MLENKPIPQQILNQAAARQKKVAEAGIHRQSRKVERVAQIDPVLFHNGIQQGRRLGVKKQNPWDDADFASEMSRENPEIGDMSGRGGGSAPSAYLLKAAQSLVRRGKLPTPGDRRLLES